MAGEKVFIGPKMRELRHARSLTQAQFAKTLGVSASYINLIERNQRPASLKFLITLSDAFGLNWRELTSDKSGLALSDLRQLTKDTVFGDAPPDIEELRGALEHAPNLVNGFMRIYNTYRSYGERLAELNEFLSASDQSTELEYNTHDFFRSRNNYFDSLERCAEECLQKNQGNRDELFGLLKRQLQDEMGIEVSVVRDEILGLTLRYFDRKQKKLLLSDGLDHTNKIFQMAHMVGLIEYGDVLNGELPDKVRQDETAALRFRVELANYFAAALLMPYQEFYDEAVQSRYDVERLAARFSVSYEQACHRLSTLQRPGQRGIPFFFLRIDRGGNVSKRFNVTPIQLARFGGACPKLDVHYCFRVPGRILTQVVEMPDHSRYLTVNRTVDRPSIRYSHEDKRLAVSLGCPVEYAPELVYGKAIDPLAQHSITEIGVNCRLCPRLKCQQRAHDPFHTSLELDEDRRGVTHFES